MRRVPFFGLEQASCLSYLLGYSPGGRIEVFSSASDRGAVAKLNPDFGLSGRRERQGISLVFVN